MPKRITAIGVAAAALLTLPSAALAGVTDVTVSQSGDAVLGQPASATFTANAFDNGGPVINPIYYFATDCTDPSDPSQYSGGSGATIQKTYNPTFTTPGLHVVCAAVYSQGQSAFAKSSTFPVTEVDPGPVAALTVSPLAAKTGDTVTFDASGSVNKVPGALTYTFDVDGDPSNGYEVDNGTNPIVTHVYLNNFSQTVGVRVIDRNNLASSATAQLTVSAPVVLGPTNGAGQPINTAAPGTGDGPLVKVTFTAEKTTIQQFLTSGMVCRLIWGDVFGKAQVSYYLVTTTGKGKKKKTKKTLIVSAKDDTFYSPGSGFTREAQGKVAKTLRKLKKATIEIDWTVTSKKGDKKSGVYKVTIPQGLR